MGEQRAGCHRRLWAPKTKPEGPGRGGGGMTTLRSGSGPGHHDLAGLWHTCGGLGPQSGRCLLPGEGPEQVNCFWDETAPMPSNGAPSPGALPRPGPGSGRRLGASEACPRGVRTPAGLHPTVARGPLRCFRGLRVYTRPPGLTASPHSACGRRGAEAPWEGRRATSLARPAACEG